MVALNIFPKGFSKNNIFRPAKNVSHSAFWCHKGICSLQSLLLNTHTMMSYISEWQNVSASPRKMLSEGNKSISRCSQEDAKAGLTPCIQSTRLVGLRMSPEAFFAHWITACITWEGISRDISSNLCSKLGNLQTHPIGLWIFPGMETPWTVWATSSNVQQPP